MDWRSSAPRLRVASYLASSLAVRGLVFEGTANLLGGWTQTLRVLLPPSTRATASERVGSRQLCASSDYTPKAHTFRELCSVTAKDGLPERIRLNATTVAVDLAKSVFQLAVADEHWRVVETQRLTRTQFERWFHVGTDHSRVRFRCRIYDCRCFPNSLPIVQSLAVEGESI